MKLKRRTTFGFILTAEQMIPDSAPDDLDLRVFREFLERQRLDLVEEPQPELLNDLKNRGVVTLEGGEPRLTLYGLLCFGREPQKFRPTLNAWIDMVAYGGTDRASEVLLHGEARVLFEVFADRVDVTSPGELPNHMTVATALAGGHPRSRNELLAHFMTVMGWMELRGRGLPIIRREMREANGSEPRLENNLDGRYLRLSLRIRPAAA